MNFFWKNIFKSKYRRKIEEVFATIEEEGLKKSFGRFAHESHLFYNGENAECQIFWDTIDCNPNISLKINNVPIDLHHVKECILKKGNFESSNTLKQNYYIYNLTPLEVYLNAYAEKILDYIQEAK